MQSRAAKTGLVVSFDLVDQDIMEGVDALTSECFPNAADSLAYAQPRLFA